VGQGGDDTHRRHSGNRPLAVIALDCLTPRSLGALLALYEHKVYVHSLLWGINAFDQFGVELGKKLANGIFDALHASDAGATTQLGDATSRALVEALRERDRTR
jgi:glucose-6-phosphate isomerase